MFCWGSPELLLLQKAPCEHECSASSHRTSSLTGKGERLFYNRGAFSFFTELHPNGERGLRGKGKEKSALLVTMSLLPWGTGNWARRILSLLSTKGPKSLLESSCKCYKNASYDPGKWKIPHFLLTSPCSNESHWVWSQSVTEGHSLKPIPNQNHQYFILSHTCFIWRKQTWRYSGGYNIISNKI